MKHWYMTQVQYQILKVLGNNVYTPNWKPKWNWYLPTNKNNEILDKDLDKNLLNFLLGVHRFMESVTTSNKLHKK